MTAIIPVLNGSASLSRCLEALRRSSVPVTECVVVDDHSTDGSAELAARMGAIVVGNERNTGPAAARNRGAARASGDLLVFIDSDVCVEPGTLESIVGRFAAEPELDALIGSYDDHPDAPGFISQYKNLLNHYFHQRGNPEASTFWSACGAIRREVFMQIGGFDESYRRPSIEDIELGCRLRRAGHQIALDRTIQVKHLKRWTLGKLIRSDICERALPWTRLILHYGQLPNDLNVSTGQRITALLVWISTALAIASWMTPLLLAPGLAAAACAVALNHQFFRILTAKRGRARAVAAIPIYLSYYLYSSIAFAAGLLLYCWHMTPTGAKSAWVVGSPEPVAGYERRSTPTRA